MTEPTQRELLISVVEMQSKQGSDLIEIKTCLLGDKYHPEGLVHKVKKNTECMQKLKRRQSGFFAIIGGAWTAFVIGLSLIISNMKN